MITKKATKPSRRYLTKLNNTMESTATTTATSKKKRNKPVYTGILVNLRMPQELHEKFHVFAKKKGTNFSDRVRKIMEADLAGKIKI
jgi:hypothetical protein